MDQNLLSMYCFLNNAWNNLSLWVSATDTAICAHCHLHSVRKHMKNDDAEVEDMPGFSYSFNLSSDHTIACRNAKRGRWAYSHGPLDNCMQPTTYSIN